MRKKFSFSLMLISILLLIGGVTLAVTCPNCGSPSAYYVQGSLGDYHYLNCDTCLLVKGSKHNWGAWTKTSSSHTRKCSTCGAKQSESHNYGTTTQNGCLFTQKCSTCGYTNQYTSHNWNSGVITTQPTCTTTGVKTYTCTRNSSHTKTESVAKLGHQTPSNWNGNDATNHYKYCTRTNCPTPTTALSTAAHTFEYTSTSAVQHGKVCSICGYSDSEDHIWEIDYVDDNNGTTHKKHYTCSYCGYEKYDPSQNHTYPAVWERNDTHHWKICTLCGYRYQYEEHIDANQDEDCDVCGEKIKLSLTIIVTTNEDNSITTVTLHANAVPTNPVTQYQLYYDGTLFDTITSSSNDVTREYGPSQFIFGTHAVKGVVTRTSDSSTAEATDTVEIECIRQRADMNALSTSVAGGNTYTGKTVRVVADFSMTTTAFTPVGNATYSFAGTFEGNNHTISGLTVNRAGSYAGLFGKAASTSIVRNLNVSGTVAGYEYSAGIVGYNEGQITNVNSSITVSLSKAGYGYTGGITGWNSGTISNCTSNNTVTGYRYVGGIVGYSTGDIINCTNTSGGSISASRSEQGADHEIGVGGIAGYVLGGANISNCTNNATVTVTGTYSHSIGGIAGTMHGTGSVDGCTNTGTVSNGYFSSGGIVGRTWDSVSVSNCTNSGNTSGRYYNVGGIVGYHGSFGGISDCSNTGTVTGSSIRDGGITGTLIKGFIKGCTNDANVSGTQQVGGVVGLLSGSNPDIVVQDCSNLGNATISASYSNATSTNEAACGGIVGMSEVTVLLKIENCENYGTVRATGANGNSIGGIIGSAKNTTTVTNCYNEGQVSGGYYCTGGIVGRGYNSVSVTNCKNNGNISGAYNTGGVVGHTSTAVTISRVVNTGTVTGTSARTGGVVGTISGGTLDLSYNEGNVIGTTVVGGVLGQKDSASTVATNLYNIGTVTGTTTANTNPPGGIVSIMAAGTISNSYNAGQIINNGTATYAGSVVGYRQGGTVSNTYYLEGTAAKGISNGTGTTTIKTHDELANDEMIGLLNASQDPLVWGRNANENNGYPILKVTSYRERFEGTIEFGTYEYDGTIQRPNPIVTDQDGNVLERDLDYTVTYYDSKDVGVATAEIEFIKDYAGTFTVNFEITPRPLYVNVGEAPYILYKIVGEADPVISYTVTNYVSGETTTPSGTLVREVGETPGTYVYLIGTLVLPDNTSSFPEFHATNYDVIVRGTLVIKSKSYLMQREPELAANGELYMIGAARAEKYTYTADKVSRITLVNTNVVPGGAIESWDASEEMDGSVMAWIMPEGGKYHLYIGAEGNMIAPTNGTSLFAGYTNATEMNNLTLLNTDTTTNMSSMFANNEKLTSIDLSNIDTKLVTNMSSMFEACESLSSIDVSQFMTSNVTNMASMFKASGITSLNLENFNTANVTNMSNMFEGCSELQDLGLTSFTTGNVTMTEMFKGTTKLELLVLGENFSKMNGENMFEDAMTETGSIITQRTAAMTLASNVGAGGNIILYVPNTTAETTFQNASNYSTVFGNERIRPILELMGNDTIKVKFLEPYTDEGVTVAGYEMNDGTNITPSILQKYGYTLEKTSSVNTQSTEDQTASYTLKLNGTVVMSVTRNVGVMFDDEPPTGSISIVADKTVDNVKYKRSHTASILITASDNITEQANLKMIVTEEYLSEENIMNDGNWRTFESPLTFELSEGDGAKRVYLMLKDEVGNITGWYENAVIVESGD